MRKLTKSPCPPVLQAHRDVWTNRYISSSSSSGDRVRPWRHPDILSALASETHGKCAYCEGIIGDVGYPHVEHVLPKSIRPELVVAWDNLTLGCTVCNTNKGDYHSVLAPLLNPYVDDVEHQLVFVGPAVFGALGSDVGARTVGRLRLMRASLLMERMKRIEALFALLDRWERAHGPDKDLFAELVADALSEDQEFVRCLRDYARTMGFPM